MRSRTVLAYALTLLVLLIVAWGFACPTDATAGTQVTPFPRRVFMPQVGRAPTPTSTPLPTATAVPTPRPTATLVPTAVPTAVPTITPSSGIEWDPRLDLRHTQLIRAQVMAGQGYWKLVKGVWYDQGESVPFGVGDHHVMIDTRDSSDQRKTGIPVRITSYYTGETLSTVYSESKGGEAYAGNFPMAANLAPAYQAQPQDGNPADAVTGMGMGSISDPWHTVHTSYGFVWRWTIATSTSFNYNYAARRVATPMPNPTLAPVQDRSGRLWDPRLDQLGLSVAPAQPSSGLGYWRLTKAVWYGPGEAPDGSLPHIYADTVSQDGSRMAGVGVTFATDDGSQILQTISTEQNASVHYGAAFPMWGQMPAYSAFPSDGHPADIVRGLGLGTIEDPWLAENTSFELVWQWTVAP
jgi:hypothetical protein